MARLILMCGLPGSGKTTVARRLAEELDAIRLSPDEWLRALGFGGTDEEARDRVERLQWRLAQRLLQVGQTAILESGFWSRSERDAFRLRAQELGAAVELRFLDASVDDLWERVQARNRDATEDFKVTREELELWASWFEMPDEDELSLFDSPIDQDGE